MTTRRHVTIVLDQDQNGRPVEICRASQMDEYPRSDGSMGYSPAINVTQDSLERLLPDRAELMEQIARAISARETAEAALRSERATTEQRIRDAETAADLRVARAEKEANARSDAAQQEAQRRVDEAAQVRLVSEAAVARASGEIASLSAERDALVARLRELLEPEVFDAAFIKQVLADRGLLDRAAAIAEGRGLDRVWLDASTLRVSSPLLLEILAALDIATEKFWAEVRALRDSVQ